MGSLRRRINCVLSGVFPEKRLFIQTDGATRYFRISPLSQLMIGTTALAAAGWMAVATASVVSDFVATDARGGAAVELREAYQARLDELAAERDKRAAEAHSAQGRFQLAMDQVSRQQTDLLAAVEERRELSTALDLMRDRLRGVVAQRDSANSKLMAETQAGDTGEDLEDTLRAVSDTLNDVAGARDLAEAERAKLAEQVADLRLRAEVNSRRQAEMMDQIDQAVVMSLGPMQKVFAEANVDLDSLLAKVRADYSGEGGPLGAAVMSSRNYDDGATSRFDTMMVNIDRMNLMRIAAGKVPLAVPVHDIFRASISRRRRVRRSSPPPMAWWSRRNGKAAMATWSVSATSLDLRQFTHTRARSRSGWDNGSRVANRSVIWGRRGAAQGSIFTTRFM